MNDVAESKRRLEARDRFLLALYKLSKGQVPFHLSTGDIQAEAVMPDDEARWAAGRLKAENFIRRPDRDTVATTLEGVVEAERLLGFHRDPSVTPASEPPKISDDVRILLREMYRWQRSEEERGQESMRSSRHLAHDLGWPPIRISRVLQILDERRFLETNEERGLGVEALRLNARGMLEAETLAHGDRSPKEITPLTGIKIFISHSSKDRSLAEGLIGVIEAGLEAPHGTIRCTSVPGYALEGGDNTPEVLRADIQACGVLIGILTSSSLDSNWVLLELGGAWVLEKRVIPLIGPGASFEKLPGRFGNVHALRLSDESAIMGLIETLAKHAELARTGNDVKVHAAVAALARLAESSALAVAAARVGGAGALPNNIPDEDLVMMLKRWLASDSSFVSDEPISFAEIDRGAAVPPGTAGRLLEDALGERYKIVERSAGWVTLRREPAQVTDVNEGKFTRNKPLRG